MSERDTSGKDMGTERVNIWKEIGLQRGRSTRLTGSLFFFLLLLLLFLSPSSITGSLCAVASLFSNADGKTDRLIYWMRSPNRIEIG